jgi:2-methylcitrate dehydratase PrpD
MNDTSTSEKPTAASLLASFAANLRFDDIPPIATERATHCVIDAVACALFGARFPWCKMVLDQTSLDQGGAFLAISPGGGKSAVREAALAWGTQSHAFELDSLCRPSAGVHPGATVALPALAMAQARGSSGRALIKAIVAGCEVMFRIGTSTLHSPEKRGFHAPGLNGPFGAAIACGSLMGLSAAELGNALGIAGSLGSGLLAFSKARRGGMVKRLHMGRAAEGGVLAAQLAADGFDGPDTILDGKFGVLEAYCDHSDPSLLTADIGTQWKIQTLCLKPFACHINAHAPAQLLRDLMREHGFGGGEITSLRLGVSDKVLSHHTSRNPADVMQAQYSVPYVTAIAAYRDPSDPNSFSENVLADAAIRNLAERVELRPKRSGSDGWGVEMSVTLRDGRIVESALDSFIGCPDAPFSIDRLRRKFMALTEGRRMDRDGLFRKLESILSLDDVGALWP